jgi:predicted peptidase
LVAVLALNACSGSPARVLQRHVFERKCECGRTMRSYDCYVALPQGYEEPARKEERWPLLVYLPGMLTFGRSGREISGGPPKEIEKGRRLPMVVLQPVTPTYLEPWTPDLVLAIVDHACATYRIDPNRIYVSGVSIGGVGAWDFAQAHPERVAALVPVAAWGTPWAIERMVDVPVWAFHGGMDWAISPAYCARMVGALRAAGGKARYTCLCHHMHWIWDEVYARDDLYAWMLAQRKHQMYGSS